MYLETSHLYVSDVSMKIKVLGPNLAKCIIHVVQIIYENIFDNGLWFLSTFMKY